MSPVKKPKHKLSRREGKDLFGTGGESLQRRLDVPPGQHGRSGSQRREQSEYAKQLRAKQMVKRMYGMREAQFRRFFNMALRTRGITGLALLQLLERRLDNVVYRLGFARTRMQARQLVTHRPVNVDGSRVNIPSYLLKPGQMVEMREGARQIPDLIELNENKPPIPEWLVREEWGGRVERLPERHELDPDIEEQRIVEFYSR
jgi:small subunit ribosomal protein S4